MLTKKLIQKNINKPIRVLVNNFINYSYFISLADIVSIIGAVNEDDMKPINDMIIKYLISFSSYKKLVKIKNSL